ncbi:hypothetical protein QBC37DRAFT_373887 [Rhypophila decipiens]|uniref:F-box domain-containing protein n=1 Tax=Rhypophila decipiens TaxID=261697 RepID=A0AAN6Y7I5_9PEZI|nr:hypothetical protein QBC37DRAFT_373887 [Rhypophila decipiens]
MDADEFATVARGLKRKLLEIDEHFFDRQTAPGQPLITGPPNLPGDQADPMDIDTDSMDAETDPMDAVTDRMDTKKKRPLAFEALPHQVLDRISAWLTGADVKRLCLSSKALQKAFVHRKVGSWCTMDTVKLPHMPNLLGLQLHIKFSGPLGIIGSSFYKSMVRCYGGSLKTLYLHFCMQERQDAWTFRSPVTDGDSRGLSFESFDPAVLDSISRDFKGLEWLAIQGVPVFGEGNGRILVRPFNKAADACIEPLKRFNGLKRLVLEFYQDTSAQDRLAYHHPARKGEEDTYILRNIQFARRLLASLPSLEEIYLFSANNTYIRFDRDLIGRMGDSNLPDLVTWGHGDELPAGVWPLGNKLCLIDR